MEGGRGEMPLMGEDLDPSLMGMFKENGHEGRSGNEQLEGISSDDQDGTRDKWKRKKMYHRHTQEQIQQLEDFFENNKHPDEQQRVELSKKLKLDVRQVKFWFQNRRTQLKTQIERYAHVILKDQMDQLLIENIRMREALRNPICNNCGGPANLCDIAIEEHHLMVQNAQLRHELSRISIVAHKYLGRPISSLAASITPPMSNSSLELEVGRNAFGSFSSVDTTFPMGLDSKEGLVNDLQMVPMPTTTPTVGMGGNDIPSKEAMFLDLALRAMNELVELARTDNPLWVRSLGGGREVLNNEEYMRIFPTYIGMKPGSFVSEATRATGEVFINSSALVETMMDANQWAETFPCMIGRSSIINVFSSGMAGSRNYALQLMSAEFQVLSPLVPIRPIKFLRFCRHQPTEGVWAVVDVSIDNIPVSSDAGTFVNCRRLASGCIVQDMPNGCSKVTWIEHWEYDESAVHHLYRPFLSSGMGFGAQRWLSTVQRQSECLAALISFDISSEDHAEVTPIGKRSMVMLAQRMTRNFCAGVCATLHTWLPVQVGNVGEDVRLMIRQNMDIPSELPGFVLSATASVWMSVPQQLLFDFLQNGQLRSEWDELSHSGPMEEMVHITKGQDRGNGVSLLRATAANTNQNTMLILQETQTDALGSLIVYTTVDAHAMQAVMGGGDSTVVALLPSGFAMVPDCFPADNNCNGTMVKEGGSGSDSGGSLLTLGLQILVNSPPSGNLPMESLDTVNNLISRTIQRIKAALNCTS